MGRDVAIDASDLPAYANGQRFVSKERSERERSPNRMPPAYDPQGIVRSYIVLNSPWQGTGNRSRWSFSGNDDAALRACLERLNDFRTPDPTDWWTAAVVFYFSDPEIVPRPEGAWTAEGALKLAELLPDDLADVRDDLIGRFANRAARPS